MARTINVKLILELRHSGMSINDIARSNHISKHSVCTVCRIYKDAVFDTNEKASIRHTNPGNTLKSRAFTASPVIPAEL